jgi:hypothetical protein
MADKRDMKRLEQWFDGELKDGELELDRILNDATAAEQLHVMKTIRGGVEAVRTKAEIADPQFQSFLEGIRERVQTPTPRWRGWWAVLSLSAAVLLAAISTFAIISYGPKQVSAETEIEQTSTDIEGGKASSRKTENGTIVWVETPQKDIL